MKKYILLLLLLVITSTTVHAENIHFNDSIYKLKTIENDSNSIENEYYIENENNQLWNSKIEITHLSEFSNPLKYASEFDKKISKKEDCLLLKFIQNKKQDIAVISYLENEIDDDCACFIYNVLKYEKHPNKGIMVLKFSKKYPIYNNEDIKNIAKEVKTINNDYMERIVISPIPPIVNK